MDDVFICYNWDDKDWADALHDALEALGVRAFQDDKGIPYGDTLDPALRTALLGSRMLVPLMTPTFHDSPSCRRELLIALTAAYRLDGHTERVMPITWRVRPSALRPRQLKAPKLLTREGHDVAEQAEIVAAKLARVLAADDRRFGDAAPPDEPEWYPRAVPVNKRFQGRGEVMWELHESLRIKAKPGNRGHPVVSVRGDGGEGKTALCEEYARLFAEDHPGGVFVIRLGGSDRRGRLDPTTVRARFRLQLRDIADNLGVEATTGGTDELAAAIGRKLRERGPYLWLVDDVPSAVDEPLLTALYAPTDNGRTLLTTRGELAGVVSEELVLDPLDERSCVKVLTAAHKLPDGPSAERSAALGIVTDLGRNALGLTIAAGLTRTAGFTGYAALRQDLRRTLPDALEMAAHLTDVPLAHRKEFSATVLRSLRALSDEGRDALAVSSVLGDAPLPLDLVEEVLRAAVARPATGFDTLVRHGLATRLGDDSHRVHALLARAARFHFPAEYRRRLHVAAVDVIGDSLEAARDRFDVTRSLSSRLPHVLTLATTDEWPPGPSEWHALNEAGRAQYDLGDTAGALYSLQILHRSCESSAAADEETRLVALVSLAAAHFGQGDYTTAAKLQRESVARLSALVGATHADTLQAKENLANTLGKLGDHDESLALHRSVYRDRSDLHGSTSPRTLTALNNLVLAVGRSGLPKLALRLALGAWARWHRAAGPDAPGTLDAVEAIGHNLLRLGHAEDAANAYDHVAAHRHVVLGPDHPDTIDARENAAIARGWAFWVVYAERLRAQGPAHIDTLETAQRLLNASLRSAPTSDVVTLDDVVVEVLELAAAFADQESAHGPADPRALRANVVLAHALGAAGDVVGDQLEEAVAIAEDARDGLAEAAARTPLAVEPFDLDIAEIVHHWLLDLAGEQPDY
ncbi:MULTISPECIES: tetratricopeptide repeat protein [unclassified Saccharothrix]|uniref:tetratricopeptide repeat protein n=1 Tax=unclassified Saccharothrix TaxID=2593673 RepID=UPI00307F8FF0